MDRWRARGGVSELRSIQCVALVLGVHLGASLALESSAEIWAVAHRTVHPEFRKRVKVCLEVLYNALGCGRAAPDLAEGNEKQLLRSPGGVGQDRILVSIPALDESVMCKLQASVVRHILPRA